MTSIIAPPALLSAYSLANWGQLGTPLDDFLPEGTHLRINAALRATFPITPFFCFRMSSFPMERFDSRWLDRNGRRDETFDPASSGPFDILIQQNEDFPLVRLDLELDPGSTSVAALLDRDGRPILDRDAGPWLFSAPVMNRLFLASDSPFASLRPRAITIDQVATLRPENLVASFGLPVGQWHRWYLGMHERAEALDAVRVGAPLRSSIMDDPEGAFRSLSDIDEIDRVERLLAYNQAGAEDIASIEDIVNALVDAPRSEDNGHLPWRQEQREKLPPNAVGTEQTWVSRRLAALQIAAMDPGVGRFFGFGGTVWDKPSLEGEGDWDVLGIATLMAYDPAEAGRVVPELATAPFPAPYADGLQSLIAGCIADRWGASVAEVEDEIARITGELQLAGVSVVPFITFTAPTPPWRPPQLPEPTPYDVRWQTSRNFAPSQAFRAGFAFHHAPLVTLSALARSIDGAVENRHEIVNARALPGIFGTVPVPLDGNNPQPPPVPVLSDSDIPAAPAIVAYQACASDPFGRFGPGVVFGVTEPIRPDPPPPHLQYWLALDDPDPASDDPLSPGKIDLFVAVPDQTVAKFSDDDRARLGSAIVVPRIDDLPAGAWPLTRLHLQFEGASKTIDLDTPGLVAESFPLLALLPMQRGKWILRGQYEDSTGAISAPKDLVVKTIDRRPPKVVKSGLGVYWTARPGPAPEVEVRLKWPAATGARFKVYLADGAAIGTPKVDAAHSRGLIGAMGCQLVADGDAAPQERFSLLHPEPVVAGANKEAVLDARLPRSLESVQFLRVVPLGPDGAEPPFHSCGIVPVAVPESRRPPAPTLAGVVDSVSGYATLTIETDTLDKVILERDEPGIFDPAAKGATLPQYRLRRTSTPIADPIYGREIEQGDLTLAEVSGNLAIFRAEVEDTNAQGGLSPFVRYTYWAEVRMPPERRLPAGWVPLEPDGGITTLDPLGAMAYPRLWSAPSAPLTLMLLPDELPSVPVGSAIETSPNVGAGAIDVTLSIANPPKADPRAIDTYRLAVWSQVGDRATERVAAINGAPPTEEWVPLDGDSYSFAVPLEVGEDGTEPLRILVGLVDPTGRLGPLRELTT